MKIISWACEFDALQTLKFYLDLKKFREQRWPCTLPHHHRDFGLVEAAFNAASVRGLEMILAAVDDVGASGGRLMYSALVAEHHMPLLHCAVGRGIQSDRVALMLRSQWGDRWMGYTPADYAMKVGNFEAFDFFMRRGMLPKFETGSRDVDCAVFNGHLNESERCRIFEALCGDSQVLDLMRKRRAEIVVETCRGGNAVLLDLVIKRLGVAKEDISTQPGTERCKI